MPAITTAKYEATRGYYSAHLGLGKIIDINDASGVDIYSKMLLNKLGKKEVEVVGDKFLLDSTVSLLGKLGFRYKYALNESLDIYAGASYEREFKGEAKGYNLTHNATIESPSIKGNVYGTEIGVKLNTVNNIKLDFNLQGMAGKKRGVNGTVGAEWRF